MSRSRALPAFIRLENVLSLAVAVMLAAGCGTPPAGMAMPDGGGPVVESCTDGARRCKQTTLQICSSSLWADLDTCTDVCDAALGCVECQPNSTLCEGANVIPCDAQGRRGDVRVTCKEECIGGTCTDPCGKAAAELSYAGCTYFPTVTSNAGLIESAHFAVAIVNPSTQAIEVDIQRGGMSVRKLSIEPETLQRVDLPWVKELKNVPGDFASVLLRGGAYKLTSSAPVSAYQFNPIEFQVKEGCNDPMGCYTYSNDASLLLPSTTLTGHYIAIARQSHILKREYDFGFTSFTGTPGFISIVAAENGITNVTVKLTAATLASKGGMPAAYPAGGVAKFQIDEGDVVQLLSASPMMCNTIGPTDKQDDGFGGEITVGYCDLLSTDLTGTEITADRKIAVFGGHDCTFIPFNRWACDHIEDQLLPIESWGKHYLATHTQRQPATIPDVWRVVSGAEDNTITFYPGTIHEPAKLGRGQFIELTTKENFEVKGSGPFQLVQYMVGQSWGGLTTGGTGGGDPAMAITVPVEQYRKQYVFLTPDTYTNSYVNVTAPLGIPVTLDGKDVDAAAFRPIDEGRGKYAVAKIALEPGTHSMSAQEPIGIAVYGMARYTSYMFAGGLDVHQINIQ